MKKMLRIAAAAGGLCVCASAWGAVANGTPDQKQDAVSVRPAAAAPQDTRDGRVQIGDVKISRPRWGETAAQPAQPPAPATENAAADKPSADPKGAADLPPIEIPANTLGPGEPRWVTSDRESAARRIGEARALTAERDAAAVDAERYRHDGVIYYGGYGGRYFGRTWPRSHVIHRGGLTGRAGTVEINSFATQAQREFFEASYPRIGTAINAMQQGQVDFANSARTPVGRIAPAKPPK